MRHLELIADGVIAAVKAHVANAVSGLARRLDAIETALKSLPPAKDGAPGERGLQGERGEKGMDGAPGRDGIDGKDGAPGERGVDGINGKDGAPGERGSDGTPGAPGETGPKGDAGEKGEKGDRGEPGQPGERGQDGKSFTIDDVRQMFEAEQAKWALEWERRAADLLQRAVDRLPAPKDGVDGFSLEDFGATLADDGRTLSLRFVRPDLTKEVALRLDTMIYRGVWRQAEYERGDTVTTDGSLWHCNRKTLARPGDGSDDWTLCAKRGNHGKDATPGDKGETRIVSLR